MIIRAVRIVMVKITTLVVVMFLVVAVVVLVVIRMWNHMERNRLTQTESRVHVCRYEDDQ